MRLSVYHQFAFSHYSGTAANEDVPIGLNPCSNHRRPPHGFALDEGALRLSTEATALL